MMAAKKMGSHLQGDQGFITAPNPNTDPSTVSRTEQREGPHHDSCSSKGFRRVIFQRSLYAKDQPHIRAGTDSRAVVAGSRV
jgi:hypothetical protein